MTRQEYLVKWRAEHGNDYYNNHKEEVLFKSRQRREKQKGAPLREYNKINLKSMTQEERNEYNRIKNKESRLRKKLRKEH